MQKYIEMPMSFHHKNVGSMVECHDIYKDVSDVFITKRHESLLRIVS